VVLVVEDLHWLDPTSEEWLTALVERLPGAALLLLTTARLGYQAPWLDQPAVTQLALAPLRPGESQQMVQTLLAPAATEVALGPVVVAKAGGNPFFLEELAWAAATHAGALTPWTVPETIQAVLAARVDQLPAPDKHVLQVAAVIGLEVPVALLQAVTGLADDGVQTPLETLRAARCLYETHRGPTPTYTFPHGLLQEVVYQSLLWPTRQQLHAHLAQVLTTRFPEVGETQPALLAHHYTEAGLAEPAVVYWQRAGQHASDRSAHMEAISHCTTGIELLMTLPETPARSQHAVTLYSALGAALQMAKGLGAPEVEHAYTQARALCQQVGETPQLIPVLFGLWRFYNARSQLHTARELGETLLRLAQRTHDPALSVIAHYALGYTWLCLGALPAARTHLEEGSARYRPDQRRAPGFRMGHDPGVACRAFAAMPLWLLGYPVQALARVHEALALAHELSHPFSLAFARYFVAIVSQFRRDVSAVHAHAEAAVTLATAQGFALWAALGTLMRWWALAMQGQGKEGLAQVRQGIAAWRATGAAVLVPCFCTWLAEVCAHLGHTAEGLQALTEAHTLVEQHEKRYWEAEVCRLRGVVLLRQPGTPQAEAETWLQRALDVAHRQEAKALELRAAMSLSRLWQQQGKQAEARALLAPVYDWFTEGFDTADLQEAQALLAELGGEHRRA
jgi:predicted ATPase